LSYKPVVSFATGRCAPLYKSCIQRQEEEMDIVFLTGFFYRFIRSSLVLQTCLIISDWRPTPMSFHQCSGIGITRVPFFICKCLHHVKGHWNQSFFSFSMICFVERGMSLGIDRWASLYKFLDLFSQLFITIGEFYCYYSFYGIF